MRNEAIVTDASISLREVLDRYDQRTFVTVTENHKVIGVFTDGDLRRHIVKGFDFSRPIVNYLNREFIFASVDEACDQYIEKLFKENPHVNVIPVLKDGFLEFFRYREINVSKSPHVTLLIIAGGLGSRLRPLTDILPKALIPINGRAILHRIIERLDCRRVVNIVISTGHMSEYLDLYISRHHWNKSIATYNEPSPLGTAGVLALRNLFHTEICVVSNCDVLVDVDINHIIDFHIKSGSDMTVVASLTSIKSTYGVCEIDFHGNLVQIREKPEIPQVVNTGVYVINLSAMAEFKPGEKLDMDEVITKFLATGKKVKIYQISAGQWYDIGQMPELYNTINSLNVL